MDYKEEYINQIANHLLNDNLALFIGAGFSMEFGYPSWRDLLSDIIKNEDIRESLEKSNIFPLVKAVNFDNSENINKYIIDNLQGVDYLRLAGYIDFLLKEKLGTNIHYMVIDKINHYESQRLKTEETKLIIEFFNSYKEYLSDIITTNYDTNIEYCMNNEVSVISRNLATLNDLKGKNRLYKIHGCIKDAKLENSIESCSSIVITERDYHNFKAKNRYLFYKTYSIFTEKKVVFLGYSINDPNIRSLLNDVIEESNQDVNLQMYWINKYKMQEIDKDYYEKNYGIRILENISLKDFFIVLQNRIEKNKELRKIDVENIEEYSKEYISKYRDDVLVYKIFEDEKELEVLNYLYLDVVKNENENSIAPFFKLLVLCDTETKNELRLKVQGILELNSKGIYRLIDEMKQNKEIVTFIIDNGFKNVQIKSLLNYCDGNHFFGEYATCIKYLLKVYEIYNGIEEILEEEYIDVLSRNIMISSKTKFYGYDWYGVTEIEKHIHILIKDHITMLLKKYGNRKRDDQRREQVYAIINCSSLTDNDKKLFIYDYLLKFDLKYIVDNMIEEILYEYLEDELNYKYKRKVYKNIDQARAIVYKINEDNDVIEYLIEDETNNCNIIKIQQLYFLEDDRYCFSLNEDVIKYYSSDIKVKELENRIYDDFKSKIELLLKEKVY